MSTILMVVVLGMLHAQPDAAKPATSNASPEAWRAKVGPDTAPETIEPIEAPFDMPQLTRPEFPDRVVTITDYGAVGDGVAKNTEAIRAAIEDCAKAGGGMVRVPGRNVVDRRHPPRRATSTSSWTQAPSCASQPTPPTTCPSCLRAGPGSSVTTTRPSSTLATAKTSPSPVQEPSTATASSGGPGNRASSLRPRACTKTKS